MKIGIPGWAGNTTLSLKVVEALAIGADYVEFSLDYPWPDLVGRAEVRRCIEMGRKKKLGFAFHSPYNEVDLASPRKLVRKAGVATIKKTILFAKKFSPLYYNLHPTSAFTTTLAAVPGVADVILASFMLSLEEISGFARKHKVNLAVENTIEPFFGQPEYVELFLKVPNLKFCFDVGHAELLRKDMEEVGLKGKSVEWWIKKFKKKLFVAHLQDVLEKRDNVVLGKGIGNWKKWLRELEKAKVKHLLIETQFSGEDADATLEEFHEEMQMVRRRLK